MVSTDDRVVRTEDGVGLRAVTQGTGPALVLCHGGPGLWDYLDDLASMLEDLFQIWRYDQRGCGRSGGVDGPYTLDRFVADLDAVRAAAGEERVLVGGHSWGATLALLYATTYPDRVAGLLYVCGTGIEWPRWRSMYHKERERRLSDSRFAELSAAPRHLAAGSLEELRVLSLAVDYAEREVGLRRARDMLGPGFEVNVRCAALNAEVEAIDAARWVDRCSHVTAPVLIVQGRLDPRPLEALDPMVRALPNVQRIVLDGAAHYPWLEAPGEFRVAVERWLRPGA